MKNPTTIKEQVELLNNRNLVIVDCHELQHTLSSIGYYRFSGYFYQLQNGDDYFYNSEIDMDKALNFVFSDDLIGLHKFDSELREIVYSFIFGVEVKARAIISNTVALELGKRWHLQNENFPAHKRCTETNSAFSLKSCKKTNCPQLKACRKALHCQLMKSINRSLRKSDVEFVKENKRRGTLEKLYIWQTIQVLTFSELSRMYSLLPEKIQRSISKQYGSQSFSKYLGSWYHTTVILRNIVAHYDRLYNRSFSLPSTIPRQVNKTLASKGIPFDVDNTSLFSYIISSYPISNKEEWENFISRLIFLVDSFSTNPIFNIKLIGFPANWREVLSNM